MYNCGISVVIPTYQSQDYLGECLDSLLLQDFTDFEIIVVNEYKSVECEAIINSYTKKDTRIKIIQNNSRLGLAASLNVGIAAANGKYIARMDADDIAMPYRLSKQYNFMQNNEKVDICGANAVLYYENTKNTGTTNYPLTDGLIKAYLLFSCVICHPTVMFRKSSIKKYKIQYNETLCAGEDYALWTSLLDKAVFANLKLPLIKYRIHKNNASTVLTDATNATSTLYLQKNFEKHNVLLSQNQAELVTKISQNSAVYCNSEIRTQICRCAHKIALGNYPFEKKLLNVPVSFYFNWAKTSPRHAIAALLNKFKATKSIAVLLQHYACFNTAKAFIMRKIHERKASRI